MHICITWSWWVNSLWPGSAWWHQAITCINVDFKIVWFRGKQFTASAQDTTLYNEFENYTFNITATFPRVQWVKPCISMFINRPISQIPWCIRQYPTAPFCNRNVHTCAHFCYKIVHCGIWHWCILGFVRWVNWHGIAIILMAILFHYTGTLSFLFKSQQPMILERFRDCGNHCYQPSQLTAMED